MTAPANLRVTHIGGPTLLIEIDGARVLVDPAAPFDPVDAVLLSSGERAAGIGADGPMLLAGARIVLTTPVAAARLGGNSIGLVAWESRIVAEGRMRVSAAPGHGPGVSGFVLESLQGRFDALYLGGDTAMCDAVADIAYHFAVHTAVLRMHPAAACAAFEVLGAEVLVPLTDDRTAAAAVFAARGCADAVRWLEPGCATSL